MARNCAYIPAYLRHIFFARNQIYMTTATDRELRLHERVAELQAHQETTLKNIDRVTIKIEKQGEQVTQQGNQIVQQGNQIKIQGDQILKITEKMSENSEKTNLMIAAQSHKMYIIAAGCMVAITVGILFNSPEKIPSIITKFIDLF